MGDHHMSALRLVHYYPLRLPERQAAVAAANSNAGDMMEQQQQQQQRRLVRAGAHSDYGAFTILNAGSPGLQVRVRTNGTVTASQDDVDNYYWHSVPVAKGALVINLGDLMQR